MESGSSSPEPESRQKRQKCEFPPSLPFRLYRIRSRTSNDSNSLDTDIQSWFNVEPEYAFLSNFMIDLEWLISAVPNFVKIPDVVIVHGEGNDHHLKDALLKHKITHFTLHKPPLPIPFGTYHSKACILKFPLGLRVVVHTANLIYADCGNKTQGAWVQDFPMKDPTNQSSEFEDDLIQYLKKLNLPSRRFSQLSEIIKKHDFSLARGKLIFSVPGYHRGSEMLKYGHMQLRRSLEKEMFKNEFRNSPVVCQFSSLGSLDEKWLSKEFLVSLSRGKGEDGGPIGPSSTLQLIWPTIKQVQNSSEGWTAGLSIPGPSKNVQKAFLQPLWHKFDGQGIDREQEMPHIKTYARYKDSRCSWVLLSSHNLSKAAWGTLQKKETQLMIRSYELGVLFLPSLEQKYWNLIERHFTCDPTIPVHYSLPQSFEFIRKKQEKSIGDELEGIECPLPFSLPPSAYSPEDQPWISDVPQIGADSLGRGWGSPAGFYGLKESS